MDTGYELDSITINLKQMWSSVMDTLGGNICRSAKRVCWPTAAVVFLLFVSFKTRTYIYSVQFASDNGFSNVFKGQQIPNYVDLLKQPTFEFNRAFKNPCWFEKDQLRCLPYMFILGVKKCGTTDLYKRLARHPDFLHPGFREAQWFARKRFENNKTDDIGYYIKMFDNVANKISLNSSTRTDGTLFNDRYITGEKSPSNLHINSHWKELHGNENLQEPKFVNLDYIQHFIPKAKILIIFRNPVDRLFSDYFHEYGTLMPHHRPTIEEFHSIVEKGINLYKDCFKTRSVRSCVYEPSIYEETKIQIQLGIYYIYWQEILRLFPRDQILVLKTEHLRQNLNDDIKSIFNFLQIRDLSDEELFKYGIAASKKRRASRRNPMLDKTADLLYGFYEPFNKIMVELTGDSDFLYERH